MADVADIAKLVEPEVSALGFDLVRVALHGGDDLTLQIMAERPDTRQLTIDDCSALSHRLSDMFDALEAAGNDPMDAPYRLEVSSPGIDRPLTRARDFADWAGHEARIALKDKLDGRQRFNGVLNGLDDVGDAARITDKEGVEHCLPLDAIESAKLVLTDKLIAATVPLSIAGADELEEEGQD